MGEEACWFHKALDGAAHGVSASWAKQMPHFPRLDDDVGDLFSTGKATNISLLKTTDVFSIPQLDG